MFLLEVLALFVAVLAPFASERSWRWDLASARLLHTPLFSLRESTTLSARSLPQLRVTRRGAEGAEPARTVRRAEGEKPRWTRSDANEPGRTDGARRSGRMTERSEKDIYRERTEVETEGVTTTTVVKYLVCSSCFLSPIGPTTPFFAYRSPNTTPIGTASVLI